MKFTVNWLPNAQAKLMDLWLQAPDRADVTAAADSIEWALKRSPNQVGQALFDTVRSYAVFPLAVEYEVIDADRLVNVLTIWRS